MEDLLPALVRAFVTVGVPAEQIHAVGLEQVANIRQEIQVTLDDTLVAVMSRRFCAA